MSILEGWNTLKNVHAGGHRANKYAPIASPKASVTEGRQVIEAIIVILTEAGSVYEWK